MFSGIIETTSRILKAEGGVFVVENNFKEPLTIGQSIAHDGACMTITEWDEKSYTFFTMQESLGRTNFSEKKNGDSFNVERCIRYGDRVDGHFVTGHIDTIGNVSEIVENSDESILLKISFPQEYSSLIVEKGSIALNGISLTIVEAGEDFLTVSIIPHTWSVTNLSKLKLHDHVNLEFDMLGKYIQRMKLAH